MMSTSGQHTVLTRDTAQRELWLRLFQLDALPVRSPFPHQAVGEDGRTCWYYTLDPSRMSPQQLSRLAAYIAARQWGTHYGEALERIRSEGWFIDADYCELAAPNADSLPIPAEVGEGAFFMAYT